MEAAALLASEGRADDEFGDDRNVPQFYQVGRHEEVPSYLRVDLFARYEIGHLTPYARLENATDRNFEEVDGYPAPGRRWAAGVEVRF